MTAKSLQNYYLLFYNEVCTNLSALCLWKPSYFINYQINYTYSIEHNTGSLKIELCLAYMLHVSALSQAFIRCANAKISLRKM